MKYLLLLLYILYKIILQFIFGIYIKKYTLDNTCVVLHHENFKF
jgi:hypothetical protein